MIRKKYDFRHLYDNETEYCFSDEWGAQGKNHYNCTINTFAESRVCGHYTEVT